MLLRLCALLLLPLNAPAALLVDGFSTGTLTNSVGGAWASFQSAGSALSMDPAQAPGYNGAPYCLDIQYSLGGASPYTGALTPLTASYSPTDISGYAGFRFWIQGTSGSVWQAAVATTATQATNNHYAFNVFAGTSWALVEIPFSSLQQYWGTPTAWDPQNATSISFSPTSPASGFCQIGRVELYLAGEEQGSGNTVFVSPRPKADQVGYLPADTKFFSIVTQTAAAGASFTVVDDLGNTAFSGSLGATVFDDSAMSGEWVVRGDFSGLSTPGTYTVRAGGEASQPFVIAEGVYDGLWKDALRSFSLIRCGTAVNDPVTGISHAFCHNTQNTDTVPSLDRDFTGGWHNAGDFGKWVHEEAFSISHMLWLAEWRPDLGVHLPPGDPGLLAEARWGLDWLFKMVNPDGSVIHKVDSEPAFAAGSMPDTDPTVSKARYASAYSTIDAADTSAVMAQAARVFAASDPVYAAKCASASAQTWAWAQANPGLGQADPYYTDATVWQELLWAGCERFRLTRDPALAADLAARLSAHSLSLPNWTDPQLLGHFTLAFDNGPGADAGLRSAAQGRITAMADGLIGQMAGNGYAVFLAPGGYYWGSISQITGAGALFIGAHAFSGQDKYRQAALRMMDNILGVNALDHSHAALYGARSNQRPFHWAYLSQGKVMPAWLSEGPNGNASGADPNLAALIGLGTPPAKCFLDDGTSWASNEGTTDIEASFVLLSGYFHSPLPWPSPTPGGTPAPIGWEDPLKIDAVRAMPVPLSRPGQPLHLRLRLQGHADSVKVQVYSPAYSLIAEHTGPGAGPGWSEQLLPAALFSNNGLYYLRVLPRSAGVPGQSALLKVFVAR